MLCLIVFASFAFAQLNLNDFMSTKALYQPASVPIDYIDPVSQCTPRHLSILFRHGARAPTKSDISTLNALRDDIHAHSDNITNTKLAASLLAWQHKYSMDQASMLTPIGANEHYRIGQRLRAKFPSLFELPYSPTRYRFRSTSVSRAARSAQALAFGVFEHDGIVGGSNNSAFLPVFVDMVAAADDHLLRFFKLCPAYAAYADRCCEGKDAFVQRVIDPVARELSQLLAGDGMPIRWNLTAKHADAIYTACQFEHSAGEPPLWCPLLSPSALAAFEFVDDTERERGGARGNPAHDCAADLVRAMRDSLVACANDTSARCDTPVSLWFAHAETVIPLSSALGLFESRPMLDWDGQVPPPTQLSSWPVSRVSPFAANIGFVLYECANNATPDARWMVQALHNEAPIQMRNASDTVTLADWLSPKIYGDLLAVNTTERCYLASDTVPPHTHADVSSLTGTGLIVVACVASAGLVICVIAAVCALTARNRSIRSDKSGQFKTSYSKERETEQLARRFSDINAPFRLRTRTEQERLIN